jgi:hypothetical protein
MKKSLRPCRKAVNVKAGTIQRFVPDRGGSSGSVIVNPALCRVEADPENQSYQHTTVKVI